MLRRLPSSSYMRVVVLVGTWYHVRHLISSYIASEGTL